MTPPEKALPHNLDAERSVLGAILLDNKALTAAAEKLKPEDFSLGENRSIFRKMLELGEANDAIDLLTLTERLGQSRELELVGGAGYLSALVDGVPRVSNVAHYAQIVQEKAQLRNLIHWAEAIQTTAWEGLTKPEDLRAQIEMGTGYLNGHGRKHLVAVESGEFALTDLRPLKWVIQFVLPEQGLGMLYGWRGLGKTYISLEIAYSVAVGQPCFGWRIPQPRPTLYVDGEMAANRLQARYHAILRGHAMRAPEKGFLHFINPDLQVNNTFPNIASTEGQRMIEDYLQEGMFLILDNLSALSRMGKENEGEGWMPVQEWILRLRQRGISVLFDHHAGKSGTQRGFSGREDLLDVVLALKRPADYSSEEGLHCEVHFEKLRNTGADEALFPFDLTMETDQRGAVVWMQRPLKDITKQRVFQMLRDGMTIREIKEDLPHLSRWQIIRLRNKFKATSDAR